MITSLEFTSGTNAPLVMSLVDPEGFIVKSIDGLGPVDTDVQIENYAAYDNRFFVSPDSGFYVGSNAGMRNIVLQVALKPSWALGQTVSELRSSLYKTFLMKQAITVKIISDEIEDVTIVGYTETIEPNIFTKDPTIQISLVCPDPYFYGVQIGDATVRAFTTTAVDFTVNYVGDVPSELIFKVIKNSDTSTTAENIGFYSYTGASLTAGEITGGVTFQNVHTLARGNHIDFNGIPGQVSATLVTVSSSSNFMGNIFQNSGNHYPILVPGTNHINAQVFTSTAGGYSIYDLAWSNKYRGF